MDNEEFQKTKQILHQRLNLVNLHIVNKRGLMGSFTISSLWCTYKTEEICKKYKLSNMADFRQNENIAKFSNLILQDNASYFDDLITFICFESNIYSFHICIVYLIKRFRDSLFKSSSILFTFSAGSRLFQKYVKNKGRKYLPSYLENQKDRG